MIHVLIPLYQGSRAASITLCPCILLALPALTLTQPIKRLLLSPATQTQVQTQRHMFY